MFNLKRQDINTTNSIIINTPIAVGSGYNLSVTRNGSVFAWGDIDKYGRRIRNRTNQLSRPVQINGLQNIVSIATDGFVCLAVTKDGTVFTWGLNNIGQLGIGNKTDQLRPVQINGLQNIVSIATSGYLSLAITKDGAVFTWGRNNNGQLGIGNRTDQLRPVQINGLQNIVSIATSGYLSLAVTEDGTVFTWGWNNNGQLGIGNKTDQLRPVRINGLQNIVSVAASSFHSLAVTREGAVFAWGENKKGQLGIGNRTNQLRPVRINGLQNIVSIAASYDRSLAITKDGTVFTWGWDNNGRLGAGNKANQLRPVQVSGLQNIVSIAACFLYSSAVTKNGTVFVWGKNKNGELGIGNRTDQLRPIKIPGLPRCLVLVDSKIIPRPIEVEIYDDEKTFMPANEILHKLKKEERVNQGKQKAKLTTQRLKSNEESKLDVFDDLSDSSSDEELIHSSEDKVFFDQGVHKYRKKKYEQAIQDFNKTIRANPKHTMAFYYRGLNEFKLHQFAKAIQNFNKVMQLSSRNVMAFYYRGLARYKMRDLEGALQDFKKAIQYGPTNQKIETFKKNRDKTLKTIRRIKKKAGKTPRTDGKTIVSKKRTKIPAQYRCSITDLIMRDPVSTCDGQVYERQAIENWLFTQNKNTSPLSGNNPLENKKLIPAYSLKSLIASFLRKHPELEERGEVYVVKFKGKKKQRKTRKNVRPATVHSSKQPSAPDFDDQPTEEMKNTYKVRKEYTKKQDSAFDYDYPQKQPSAPDFEEEEPLFPFPNTENPQHFGVPTNFFSREIQQSEVPSYLDPPIRESSQLPMSLLIEEPGFNNIPEKPPTYFIDVPPPTSEIEKEKERKIRKQKHPFPLLPMNMLPKNLPEQIMNKTLSELRDLFSTVKKLRNFESATEQVLTRALTEALKSKLQKIHTSTIENKKEILVEAIARVLSKECCLSKSALFSKRRLISLKNKNRRGIRVKLREIIVEHIGKTLEQKNYKQLQK